MANVSDRVLPGHAALRRLRSRHQRQAVRRRCATGRAFHDEARLIRCLVRCRQLISCCISVICSHSRIVCEPQRLLRADTIVCLMPRDP